jgi:hypothetical protein
LFGNCPRDQVARWTNASLHVFLNRILADVTFKTNLDGTENIRKRLSFGNWS